MGNPESTDENSDALVGADTFLSASSALRHFEQFEPAAAIVYFCLRRTMEINPAINPERFGLYLNLWEENLAKIEHGLPDDLYERFERDLKMNYDRWHSLDGLSKLKAIPLSLADAIAREIGEEVTHFIANDWPPNRRP